MPGGIWEAIGNALMAGGQTYNQVSNQQRNQREDAERLRLAEAESARQNEWQASQLKNQQEEVARAERDRKIKQLHDAISLATPGTDVSQYESDVRSMAPELLPLMNINEGGPQAVNMPSAGMGFGGPMVTQTPRAVTKKASLQEQGAQQQLDEGKLQIEQTTKNQAIAEQLLADIASGRIKDTPANRAKLAQFTKVNPNEVWGAVRPNGATGGMSELAQTVLANPALYNRLTPTMQGKISVELGKHGFDFSKPMGEGAMKYAADADSAIKSAQALQQTLKDDNGASTGPIQGYAGSLPDLDLFQNLFGSRDTKITQASIDQAKQRIGKLFEGGVLRKEDEIKYMKILPTVYDSPQVQQAKMNNVMTQLQNDLGSFYEQQEAAGKKTSATIPGHGANVEGAEAQRSAVKPAPGHANNPQPQGNTIGRFQVVGVK